MAKKTKTKAAQAASRVLKDADSIRHDADNLLKIGYMFDSDVMANISKRLWQFIKDAETAAASCLSQKE